MSKLYYDEVKDHFVPLSKEKPKKVLTPDEQIRDLRYQIDKMSAELRHYRDMCKFYEGEQKKRNKQIQEMTHATNQMKHDLEIELHDSNGQIDNANERATTAETDVAEIKKKMKTQCAAFDHLKRFFGWRQNNDRGLVFTKQEIESIVTIIENARKIC